MGARFSTRRTVPKFDPHGGGADGFAEYTIRAVSTQKSILAEIPHRNGDRVKSLTRCQCRRRSKLREWRIGAVVEWIAPWSVRVERLRATFHIGPSTLPKRHIGPGVEWTAAENVRRERKQLHIPYSVFRATEATPGWSGGVVRRHGA